MTSKLTESRRRTAISCRHQHFFSLATKQFRATVQFLWAQYVFFPTTSVILKFIQYKKMFERGNTISARELYSPRRASRLLSDQLLKTHFSSERLPFAPVLKLKFKGETPMDSQCVRVCVHVCTEDNKDEEYNMKMCGWCVYTQFKFYTLSF